MPSAIGQPVTTSTADITHGSDVDVRQVARYAGFRPEVQGLRTAVPVE